MALAQIHVDYLTNLTFMFYFVDKTLNIPQQEYAQRRVVEVHNALYFRLTAYCIYRLDFYI